MLDRIIHFSIHNKLIVGLLSLGLAIWGIWSGLRLPIDAVPDITNNQVQVITYSPSLSPQEVERFITFPVEMSLSNIPQLVELRSISRFGLSVVTAVFTDETDVYWARQQVSERLVSAADQIPPGLGKPELGPVSTGLSEIFQYTIGVKKGYENKYSLSDLRTIQDWQIRRSLLGTPGLADVSSFGGYVKQYELVMEPEKLMSMGISPVDLLDALQKNNQNTGGGYISKGSQAWYIRSEGLIRDLDEIGEIVISRNKAGLPVLIRDVANARFGQAVRYGAMTKDDKGETVGGIVLMLKGENSREISLLVEKRIREIEKTLPEGLEIKVFLDRSELIDRAINTVKNNLLEGALIVIFVLVLMLGNLRAGLIVASVIPLSMLFALAMMKLFGVSANLMSLGAIDFGLIVDGAVIIVEAGLHHVGLVFRTQKPSQAEMDEEIFRSASKIRNSAAFGEMIILIVYLPILALTGIEGKMFAPMAQTVAFAIAGAFLLSLTYVPMMSALVLSKKVSHKISFSDRLMAGLFRLYEPVLLFSLKFKKTLIISMFLIFFASIWVFTHLGGEFIPSLDEGDFAVETRLLPGTSMDETIRQSLQAGKILKSRFPEVKEVIGKIGTSEIPTDPMPFEACDLMIILKNKEEWTSASSRDELAEKMQAALEEIPGTQFGFQQPIQMRFNELMTGARQDVAIKIYGDDLPELARLGKLTATAIEKIEGLKDLYLERVTGLPEMVVKINREKLARYNLDVDAVNRVINTAFAGTATGKIYEGEKRFDLVVRMDTSRRTGMEDLKNLFIQNPEKQNIPISELAEFSFEAGPNQIQRDKTKRRITVAFNVRGRDVESIVAEVKRAIANKVSLPPGYHYEIGGQFKNLEEAKGRLSVAVPVALFLIFVLLYFTFHSIARSLLIFSAIPLSAIGGILALWARGMPFSISAGIGFIALFGVAVLNGIVLMAEFNNLKTNRFGDTRSVILEGVKVRLRPVLMTALVASLGFLPMAFSGGAGAEVQKPLATVVIGGSVSATLRTLFILPSLYLWLEEGLLKKTNSKTAFILILLAIAGKSAVAQPRVISRKEALEASRAHYHGLQAIKEKLESQKTMKATASDLGKTNFGIQIGQYNSRDQDQYFSMSQSFPLPGAISRLREWYEQQAISGQWTLKKAEAELDLEVKNAYQEMVFGQEKIRFLMRLDSLFGQVKRASELRLRAGETNELEAALAENQAMQVKTQIMSARSDLKMAMLGLQSLMQGSDSLVAAEEEAGDIALPEGSKEMELWIENHPFTQVYKQEEKVARSWVQYEKTKIWPEFSLGYFNQSLRGTPLENGTLATGQNRFQGVLGTISYPLWQKPGKDRIKAGQQLEKALQLETRTQKNRLEVRLKMAIQEWQKMKRQVAFLEKEGLPTALLIRRNALKSFQAGDIGFLEFSQALKRSLDTELLWLESRHQLNLSKINIEFFTSQNL